MDRVGIELSLKQNVEVQLKTMLPLLERMTKHTEQLERQLMQAKGVREINRHLDVMTKHLKAVDMANRGLVNTVRALDRVGTSAAASAHKVGLLNRAMGGMKGFVGGGLGLLGGIGSIYTVGSMFSKGMDFEQQVKSLQLAGLSPSQIAAARQTAMATAANSKFITTPTEVLENIRIGTAITRNPDEAIHMAPLAAQFNRSMRQIHAPNADDSNLAELALKMGEQLGIRDEKRMKTLMDDLTKTEIAFAGQLDMQKLTQQLSMTRTAKYGADTLPLLVQLGHVITEVGSSGGGSAGARAGVQIQALNRILTQGVMTQAVASRFGQLGLINGYDEALAAKGKSGHRILIDNSTGQHVLTTRGGSGSPAHLTKGELGNLVVTGLAGRELAIKDTPEWVKQYLIPAINKAENIDLIKLSQGNQSDRTKAVGALTKWLSGMQVNAADFATQLILQRPTFAGQMAAANAAPGMDAVMQQQMSMRNNLNQLTKAWDTFSTVLTSNEHVVDLVNATFKTLTQILSDLTKGIGPTMDFFNALAHPGAALKPAGQVLSVAGPMVGQSIFNNIGHGAQNVVSNIIAAAQHYGLDPAVALATAMHESGLNPHAIGDKGTSFGLFQLHKGGELGKMTAGQAFDPMTNAMRALSEFARHPGLTGGQLAATSQRPLNPTQYAKAVDALIPKAKEIIIHNNIMLDGKKIGEHTSKHVTKALVKSAHTMHRAGSSAGGSYTTGPQNSGGNADQ